MAREIKKTMVAPLAFLAGVLTSEQLEEFTNKFGYASTGTSVATGPKEVTILRDGDVVVGRKCTVTGMFFDIEKFSKNTTCIKEVRCFNNNKSSQHNHTIIIHNNNSLANNNILRRYN